MSKPTFTLQLTLAQFNALASQLKAAGYGPEALERGTLPKTEGVLLSYVVGDSDFDGVAVTFTVEDKPFLATVGLIESQVKKRLGVG